MEPDGSSVTLALKQCQDIQHMIDITSQHLERLRSTFSDAGDELTLQEIRTLEGKLIKQFSEQMAVKYGLGSHAADLVYFPSLSQWLTVVGVSAETSDTIKSRIKSLEELKDKTECELKRILLTSSRVSSRQIPEDLRRLCRSLLNLRKYTDALMYGHKVYGPNQDPTKLELYWDSWDCAGLTQDLVASVSPKHSDLKTQDILRSVPLRLSAGPGGSRGQGSDSAASSLSSSNSVPPPSPGLMPGDPNPRTAQLMTPPATPPWVILSKERHTPPHSGAKPSLTTPPAVKKHSTSTSGGYTPLQISKSKSHESELSHKVEASSGSAADSVAGHGAAELSHGSETQVDSSGYSSSSEAGPGPGHRIRLPSSDPESGHEMSASVPSPIASPKSPNTSSLQIPRSPRTPGGNTSLNVSINRPMTHTIAHRFTKTFKPARCDFCQEYFFQGLKCKECKFRCHTQCEASVPPSCGLPQQFLDIFIENITNTGSPSLPRLPPPAAGPAAAGPPFDSSSSSCNSSTPSSPHVIVTAHPDTGLGPRPTTPWSAKGVRPSPGPLSGTPGQHFRFPPPVSAAVAAARVSVSSERSAVGVGVDTVTSNKSNDSDKTLSGSSDRSDSIGTAYRLDSQVSSHSVFNIINSIIIIPALHA